MKKIALDFDGTIADSNGMKSILIKEKLGLDIPAWQGDHTLCAPQIGEEAYKTISNIVYDRASTLETPPLPGVLELLPELAKVAEIHLLTARPEKRVAYAKEWLEKYHLAQYFQSFLSSHVVDRTWRPKLDICEENDFVLLLEDDARHLQKEVNGIARVLIKNGCHEAIEVAQNVKLVFDWQAFYDFCIAEVL